MGAKLKEKRSGVLLHRGLYQSLLSSHLRTIQPPYYFARLDVTPPSSQFKLHMYIQPSISLPSCLTHVLPTSLRFKHMKVSDNKSMDFPVVCTSFEILMIDRPYLERHLWQVSGEGGKVLFCRGRAMQSFSGGDTTAYYLHSPHYTRHFNPFLPLLSLLFRLLIHHPLSSSLSFPQYIILDEGHRIKNRNCRLVKELKSFRSVSRLLLTGTPIQVRIQSLLR